MTKIKAISDKWQWFVSWLGPDQATQPLIEKAMKTYRRKSPDLHLFMGDDS